MSFHDQRPFYFDGSYPWQVIQAESRDATQGLSGEEVKHESVRTELRLSAMGKEYFPMR